jgi:triacylglycerol lipase
MANNHPVILAHGLLGFGPVELGGLNFWGQAFKVFSPIKRHEATMGPLSSAHDRACELAAQIKGTKVDYGSVHSKEAGHKPEGDDYTGRGFVPEWSEDNPVHLIGHSLGAPTIRCLQHLLEEDHWGWKSSRNWVRSISSISGVLNGSTLGHFFGADEATGLLKKDSIASSLQRMLEVITFISSRYLGSVYDFDLTHWGLEHKKGETMHDYINRISGSEFLWGRDNAPYTLTLHGAYEDNARWDTYDDTYYFSYITEQTTRGWFSGRYYPDLSMNPGLLPLSIYIGQKEFDRPPIPVSDFKSSDWWENDGAVSSFSQKYPHTNGNHPVGGEFNDNTTSNNFERGKWYYKWERGVDHTDICTFPQITQIERQRNFYQQLFKRLSEL